MGLYFCGYPMWETEILIARLANTMSAFDVICRQYIVTYLEMLVFSKITDIIIWLHFPADVVSHDSPDCGHPIREFLYKQYRYFSNKHLHIHNHIGNRSS